MEFIRIHDGSLQTHTSFFQQLLPALPAMHRRTKMIGKCRTSTSQVDVSNQIAHVHNHNIAQCPNKSSFTCLCLLAFVYLQLLAFVYLPLFTCLFLPAMYMQWRCVHAKMLGEAILHVGVHPLNSGYIIMVFLTTLEIIYSNVLRNVVTLNSCDLMDKF